MSAKFIVRCLFNLFLTHLPRCQRVKTWVLRKSGISVGTGVRTDSGVRFYGVGETVIGNNAWLAHHVTIQSGFRIMIGNNVEVNFGTLLSANCGATLTIEDNCHIAHNVSMKCSTMVVDPTLSSGAIVGGDQFLDITIGHRTGFLDMCRCNYSSRGYSWKI